MATDAQNWNLAPGIEIDRRTAFNCPLQAMHRWLAPLGLSLCLACAETRSRGSEAGVFEKSRAYPLEQFKTFVASPPPIESLVFRQKLRSNLNKSQEYDGSFLRSTNFAVFKARTQSNAILLFEANDNGSELNYVPGSRLVSIFDKEHWIVEPRKYIETCSASSGSFRNPVTIGIAFTLANLNQVLQGGVMHVRPGDIVWNGNTFRVEDVLTPYRLRFRVEGQLYEKEGVPAELLVRYSTGNSSTDINGQWKIRYSYENILETSYFRFLDVFSGSVARDTQLACYKIEHSQKILRAAVTPSFSFRGREQTIESLQKRGG